MDGERGWLAIVMASAFAMMLVTFSAPGRSGPTSVAALDAIAWAKLTTRALAFVALCAVLFCFRRDPRLPRLASWLLPLGAFVAWAMLSALWSPLWAVSFGQASSLLVLLTLTSAVAMVCRVQQSLSAVLGSLSVSLFILTTATLVVSVSHPEFGGLRTLQSTSSPGILHPTAAATTASLGIVLVVAARGLWGWAWSRLLLVPAVAAHSFILVLAHRRLSLALAAGLLLFMAGTILRFRSVAVVLLAVVVGTWASLPHIAKPAASRDRGAIVAYLTRNQSAESLQTLTGRTVLWRAVWQEFLHSPLRGHGYFVTSRIGSIDVWDGPANYTAHNLLLQVLVSTGIVGGLLFFWGLLRPLRRAWPGLYRGTDQRKLSIFLLLVGGWYAGASLLASSFLGPLLPGSVAFFALLGLMVGNALLDTASPPCPEPLPQKAGFV